MLASVFNDRTYNVLLSNDTKEKSERIIISIAIFSFIVHVAAIELLKLGLIPAYLKQHLSSNLISAIYTPFSFILVYEVYLLVYYLSKSTSNYIGKQYEIITLIVIRRNFKDLANLHLIDDWFSDKYDLQFTYDIITALLLFFLIYLFHRLNDKRKTYGHGSSNSKGIKRFIRRKKNVAIILVPIFVSMALYSFFMWSWDAIVALQEPGHRMEDVNNIFFDEFFTVLILTDVALLLYSFFTTNRFNRIIRNSGFIISTILIRLSFGVEGIINNLLIITAVAIGVLILLINNQYEKLETPEEL
ncbi:MAG: hypothetical protein AAF789_11715 [Bacteroidota bacterium]